MRLWSSGFELNSATSGVEWDTWDALSISTTTVRSGTYAGRCNLTTSAQRLIQKQFSSGASAFHGYFRIAFRIAQAPTAANAFAILESGGSGFAAYLKIDHNRQVTLHDEDGKIGSASSALTLDTWYYIDWKFDCTGSAGAHSIRARINGVEFAGSDTRSVAAADISYLDLGGNMNSEGQSQGDWFFDDIAINDSTGSFQNTYIGNGKIIHLRPNADGDNNGWNNGTATSYTEVDEVTPDDTTTRIGEISNNIISDFNLTSSGIGASDTVTLLQIGSRFLAGGASAARFVLRVKASSGGTVEESTDIIPTNTGAYSTHQVSTPKNYHLTLYDLPGASTTTWTQTDLDAAQVGVRTTTLGSNPVLITTLWVLVEYVPASSEVTASVSPVEATLTLPSVTPTTAEQVTASVSPVTLALSVGNVDINTGQESSYVSPQATPLSKRKYTFIVESRDGTFRYATEDWEFSEITREINGSMMVRIKTNQLTTDIAQAITDLANRITIRISNENTGSLGIDYFSGYIPNRQLNLKPEDQSVEITAFGYASRLFDIIFRSGTTTTINHTSSGIIASDLAEDVIDAALAIDTDLPITYTAASVEDSVDTIKDKFVLQKCGEVLNRIIHLAYDANRIWHWTILGDNVFRFKKDSTTADHQFVFGKDVLSFPRFSEDLQQAVNEVFVVYNGGANIKRVVDQDSIDLYGAMSLVINETNVPDATTATELGNAVLASRLAPIRSITITVGSTYPIESVDPGDTCRIDGINTDIQSILTRNMFITRTVYRRDTIDIDLSLTTPYIQSQVESIRRRFEKESVETSAATTYS